MSTNETETRARTMGWLPKDQFKGPEDHWLPPDKYLERGESIMPILQANNKKLSDRLASAESELQSTKQLLTAAQDAIEGLKEFRSEINKTKVKDKKTEILDAITQAKKDGDTAAEVELTDQLSEVNVALREAEKPPPKESKPDPKTPQVTPESVQWMKENPWFSVDRRKTAFAMALADQWKADGKALGTAEFFSFVDKEVGEVFDQNTSRRESPSKVEGSNNSSGGGGGSKGRSFADLPQEARDACERFAVRLVGPGRAYKTKEDYRKAYCEKYDWS
jgi:hypothetical protein